MASTDYRVLTPERVSLQYDIAGIGSRGAAVFIDAIIQGVIGTLILLAILGGSLVLSAIEEFVNGEAVALIIIILTLFFLTVGYFMLFEIIWNGQTPGKRILGVRVIRENGYPVRPVDAVIRNLVRIVDGLPAGYAVGLLTMLFNKRSKRLGDFAAGTIVVREGVRNLNFLLDQLPEPESQHLVLNSQDATLVRDFLTRRGGMHPDARRDLAHRLATAIAARYSVSLEQDEPERFLEKLSV